jgi:hypothetical protein
MNCDHADAVFSILLVQKSRQAKTPTSGGGAGLLKQIPYSTDRELFRRNRKFWRRNREFYRPELKSSPDEIFGRKNLWVTSFVRTPSLTKKTVHGCV